MRGRLGGAIISAPHILDIVLLKGVLTSVDLRQHGVVRGHVLIVGFVGAFVVGAHLAVIIPVPRQHHGPHHNHQWELACGPGDAAAHVLVPQQIHVPWQSQCGVEIVGQDDLHLHQRHPEPHVERQRPEQPRALAHGVAFHRDGIHPDDLPVVHETGPQEHDVHGEVTGMLGHRDVVKRGEVQDVKHHQELDGVHRRVSEEPHHRVVDGHLKPLARTRLTRLTWVDGGEPQGERAAQHPEHRDAHGENHVANHVHGKRGGHVHADAGTHGDQQHHATRHEPGGAVPRPGFATLAQAAHTPHVGDGEDDGEGAENDVETPHRPHIPDGGFHKQLVAQLNIHGVQIRLARRGRRSATQRHRHTRDRRHHQYFHNRHSLEQARLFLQLRDRGLAVQPAHHDEHHHTDGFGENQRAITRGEPIRPVDTNRGVDQAR